jgi:hypothetical protein
MIVTDPEEPIPMRSMGPEAVTPRGRIRRAPVSEGSAGISPRPAQEALQFRFMGVLHGASASHLLSWLVLSIFIRIRIAFPSSTPLPGQMRRASSQAVVLAVFDHDRPRQLRSACRIRP